MARSRRTKRRSASRGAASLLALVLPAPLQRVADTRLGPMLMLVAIPTLIVAGLLNINWQNGTPRISIDQQRAAEIRNAAREKFNNFESQGGLQQLGQAATDLLHRTDGLGPFGTAGHNTAAAGPYQQNPPVGYGQGTPNAQPHTQARASFPSTQPRSTTAAPKTAPQTYAQQPAYGQPAYPQPAASPSDAQALAYQQQLYHQQQQQLYQQQLYQQQLYEQQLKQYQYQQWLTQQSAAGGTSQTDVYGRPVGTAGYAQPPSQPQYGQQNNNQGAVPSLNNRGRY